ncbi:MAG: FAD binding domain-containing protein [Deltaproteobacteria bacterium]|nr:FAD binding domain-containing protein [Deltaproteobacteria bacterium]
MADINYIRPKSFQEALDFLTANGRETRILAGGTDVMVDLRAGEIKQKYLLDISRLKELRGIELNDEGLSIGAAVTLSEIHASPIIAEFAPTLRQCAATFASQQIRNVATIGGNVAHCSPCGDTIPPLVVHEARAVLAGKSGCREIPVEFISSGSYKCSLPSDELIVRFILKPCKAEYAGFKKIGRRKALAIARVNMAVLAQKDVDGKVEFIRLALGSCTPTPWRLKEIEEFLAGQVPTEALIWQAGRMLAEKTIEITGRRASVIYKEPAIQGLFLRMLCPLVHHDRV